MSLEPTFKATATITIGEGGKLTWNSVAVDLGLNESGKQVVAAQTPLGWLSTFVDLAQFEFDETSGKPATISVAINQAATAPTVTTTSPVVTPIPIPSSASTKIEP